MNRLSWDHLYLLGWYDEKGKPFLSTWEGDKPMADVVVKFTHPAGPPIWNAPVNGATLHVMPENLDFEAKIKFATSIGGVYAFGWYQDAPIDRTPKKQ